ncbi:3-dehydroquinate dehydratase I [Methanosarcina sp. MTP4]|uniref:type I 3-dehydroquinate dehydratase n=1 Tax=Methanosarcina sp. MTP4 TaxID=1434100 RepID=UPI000615D127|nr:type I 3-dehydroquinate dehydratase [Methanosarcina sp. MTP4]AKB23527.1 3-dehydroquinate dehydratase I [Methanosarcina sp. MTP4]
MTRIGNFDLEKKAAVVAVINDSLSPLESSRKAAEMGADVLEIRLDLLGIRDSGLAVEITGKIKAENGLPLILTNRSSAEGGKWEGSEKERIEILKELLTSFSREGGVDTADAVDIELSAGEKERSELISTAKKQGKTVIVSFHDFSKTPSFQEMEKIIEEAFRAGADIAKLAVMPGSLQDILDLLRLTLNAREARRPVCTIAMGKLGKHTRVIAPLYGSVLSYASVESSAAPGQLQANEVKKMMELLE